MKFRKNLDNFTVIWLESKKQETRSYFLCKAFCKLYIKQTVKRINDPLPLSCFLFFYRV